MLTSSWCMRAGRLTLSQHPKLDIFVAAPDQAEANIVIPPETIVLSTTPLNMNRRLMQPRKGL